MPLSGGAFARLLADFEPYDSGRPAAVACSGGADSLSLTLLLRDWCRDQNRPLVALIIDHRLRPESTEEAAQVRQMLVDAGVEAHVLTHTGPVSTRNIQDAARTARYALLLGWCRQHGVRDLFLAHHQEDQAETFLLRLARGSGVDGLSAMRPVEKREGVRLLRPLLSVPKERLRAVARAAGLSPVEDPSNHDMDFARVRLRALMPALAKEGLTAARLAATARRMGRARRALEEDTLLLFERGGTLHPEGCVSLSPARLLAAPEDISLRLLSNLLQGIGRRPHPPRLAAVEKLRHGLRDWMLAADDGYRLDRTLSGCRVAIRQGELWIGREQAAVTDVLPVGGKAETVLWDGRFAIDCATPPAEAEIRAMGRDGWQQARDAGDGDVEPGVPAFVRMTLPGLWRGGRLLCPLLPETVAENFGIQQVSMVLSLPFS